MTICMSDLVSEIDSLGSFPAVYQQLDDALNDENSSINRLSEIIQHDVDLTARLLRLANSPCYAFPGEIETVGQAITMVGLQQMQDLVTARCAIDSFKGVSSGFVDMESFWRHSLACGTVARVLAVYRRDANPERMFVAGLLHDIGRLVIYTKAAAAVPEIFRRYRAGGKLLVQCEQAVLGTNHAEIGSALIKHWRLSAALAEAVACHHNPAAATGYPLEAAVVHVADVLALGLENGSSGQKLPPPLQADAWNRLGLAPVLLGPILADVEAQLEDALALFL